MPFFEFANPAHLALLPSKLAEEGELERLASLAEYDTINAYRVGVERSARDFRLDAEAYYEGDYSFVCLRGFNPDPALCSVALKAALVREIARVIEWRMGQKNKNPTASYEGGTEKLRQVTYRVDANSRLPEGFGVYLTPWDVRPSSYVI